MTIEQKIKMLLAYRGISQSELARKIGTTPSNLNQKIKNDTLSNKDLAIIAEALNAEWRTEFVTPEGQVI